MFFGFIFNFVIGGASAGAAAAAAGIYYAWKFVNRCSHTIANTNSNDNNWQRMVVKIQWIQLGDGENSQS